MEEQDKAYYVGLIVDITTGEVIYGCEVNQDEARNGNLDWGPPLPDSPAEHKIPIGKLAGATHVVNTSIIYAESSPG